MLQLDTIFSRPKKGGRGGGHQLPRPHSEADFNEVEEQQTQVIEQMDEVTLNEKFEEMLVSLLYSSTLCFSNKYKQDIH